MKTKSKASNLKLSQALQGFYLTQQARRLSSHTITDYQNTLNKFKEFLNLDYPMDDITSHHIEQFLAAQTGLSKKTLLNYHTGLCALWTWALKEHIVAEHVPHQVPAPKPEIRQVEPYTEAEIRAMLNNLTRSKVYKRSGQKIQDRGIPYPERNRALILFLVDTGVRAEELCNIKLHQLDKRNQRIRVFGKGAKERYVNFSPRTAQALWRYLTTRPDATEGDPLFAVQSGKPFTRRRLLDLLHTIGERAGVPHVNVHRFRHTFAIQYLRNRGDPYTLQRLIGHSSLDMIKRYLAIVQSDVEQAHRLASPVENWVL